MAVVSKYPSSNTVVSGTWGTPTEIYSDNGLYATCATGKSLSYYLDVSGFGFSSAIPAGSTINSVTLEVQWKVNSNTSNGAILGAQCYTSGSASGTELLNSAKPLSDTMDISATTGITTLSQLADANFKVRVRAQRGSSNTAVTCSYDYIKVTVDYTEPITNMSGNESDTITLTETSLVEVGVDKTASDTITLTLQESPDVDDNADVYIIERKTGSGGIYTQIARILYASPKTYTDNSNLQDGITYYYRMLARVGGQYSGYSDEQSITYVNTAPAETVVMSIDSNMVFRFRGTVTQTGAICTPSLDENGNLTVKSIVVGPTPYIDSQGVLYLPNGYYEGQV